MTEVVDELDQPGVLLGGAVLDPVRLDEVVGMRDRVDHKVSVPHEVGSPLPLL